MKIQNIFRPIIEVFQNSPNLIKLFLIVLLIEVILVLGYFIWKLAFDRPLKVETNNNETKNNKGKKIEISIFSYVWFGLIFPIIALIYIFFVN